MCGDKEKSLIRDIRFMVYIIIVIMIFFVIFFILTSKNEIGHKNEIKNLTLKVETLQKQVDDLELENNFLKKKEGVYYGREKK